MHYLCRAFALWCLLLNACDGNVKAPVTAPGERTQTAPAAVTQKPKQTSETSQINSIHTVARGDTLYSIAWNYGLDYRDVAKWNGITSPFVIYPGQKINLQTFQRGDTKPFTPGPGEARPLTPGPIITKRATDKTDSTIKNEPAVKQAQTIQKKSQTESISESIRWLWPTQGEIIKSDTPISKKGIDITGQIGQQINASAPGEVVYSGSGLLGYGKLIIVKHNDTYLSAYAHNSQLMVKEGDQVSAGQQIAQMGRTSNGRTLLHFEIRKNGQPENPLNYLPEL